MALAALVLAGSLAQASLARTRGGGGGGGPDADLSQVDFLEFLGGVRQFLAYVLWARIDAIHHGYYGALYMEAELIPYYYIVSWLDPHYVDSYYVSGLIIFYAGQEEEALEFTRQGIAANPDSGDLYVSLGDLYLRQERYELAREAYREARGKVFELVEERSATIGIASASLAMGDLEGAISAKRELLDEYRMLLVRPGLTGEPRDFFVERVNQLADEIRELEEEMEAAAVQPGVSRFDGGFSVVFVN